jgi:hypothetical protein
MYQCKRGPLVALMAGYTLSLRSDEHHTTGSRQWPGLYGFRQMLDRMQSGELSFFHGCALCLQGQSAHCLTKDSLGGNIGGDAAAMPTHTINWPR